MKKLFTLANLVVGTLLTTIAFTVDVTAQVVRPSVPQSSVVGRAATETSFSIAPSLRNLRTNEEAPKILKAEEYGQVVSILKEDFSKMTAGSEDSPETDVEITNNELSEYPVWFNVDPQYTHEKFWGAGNAYQAGGMLFLEGTEAKINTPTIKLNERQGNFFVRFRARTDRPILPTDKIRILVEAAETNGMGPTWNFCGTHEVYPTNEWKDYELMFQGADTTTLINIVKTSTMANLGLLIDDIEVVQVDAHVAMPTLKPYLNYKGSTVDIYWEPVENATGYLLNVYHMVETGEEPEHTGMPKPTKPEFVITNLNIEGGETSKHTITGLESGEIYFYSLVSTKGDKVSIPCLYKEIYEVEAPVLKPITSAVNGRFTASWSEVPGAERYNLWAYYDRSATADGEFVLTEEDFTNITFPDGSPAKFSAENPDPKAQRLGEFFIPKLKQSGWKVYNGAPYIGHIALDAWAYYNQQGSAAINSPEFDLSKGNGEVKLNLSLFTTSQDLQYPDGTTKTVQTYAAVALFNYDEELGDFRQVTKEPIYVGKDLTPGQWKDFEITLTGGSARSIIGIFAVGAEELLYVDNLKVRQQYKSGETFRDPCFVQAWVEGTSHEIIVNDHVRKQDIPFYVRATSVRSKGPKDQFSSASYKESVFSDYVTIQNTLGTQTLETAAKAQVSVVEGTLRIVNPTAASVVIFNAAGEQVYADTTGRTALTVEGLAKGAYVLKVGTEVLKVVL